MGEALLAFSSKCNCVAIRTNHVKSGALDFTIISEES